MLIQEFKIIQTEMKKITGRLKIYRDVGNDNFAIKSVKYTNITRLISRYPYLH